MSQAQYEPLNSACHPQRQPYVRSLSYVDGKGPAPFEFFDQFQSHAGAFSDALCGRSCALDYDEFTEARFATGYFGRMKISTNAGPMVVSANAVPDQTGVHGAGSLIGPVNPWRILLVGAPMGLASDFLFTVKLKILSPQTLDTADDGGLLVSAGNPATFPSPPAFLAGSDTATWRIRGGNGELSMGDVVDTGIPCLPGVWYRLQISRVRGAVRWFVNGQLARVAGLEGIYFPYPILGGQKLIDLSRYKPGAAGEGMHVDSCHLLAQRSTP